MNFENQKWNMAELEFNHWLRGNKGESSPERTNILKSAYLVFREKESARLKTFCNQGFEFFREKETRTFNESIRFSKNIKTEYKTDFLLEDAQMFHRVSGRNEPGYLKRKTKDENDTIIQGIFSGDQSIFDDLYEYEFPKVVRLITKNSGTLDSAKDIFQDGLVILMEKVYRKELDLT